jgi:hypothetical protein
MPASNARGRAAFRKWIAGLAGREAPQTRTTLRLEQVEAREVPATITGYAWYDTNSNGVFDAGESPAEGVGVVATPTGGGSSMSVATDASGYYAFTGPLAGSYAVPVHRRRRIDRYHPHQRHGIRVRRHGGRGRGGRAEYVRQRVGQRVGVGIGLGVREQFGLG